MILMTLDTEKAFDSVNHLFLFTAIEKYGFNEDFIKWVHILIQNLESCVINGGTMKFIMQNKNINGFNHLFLNTAIEKYGFNENFIK